MVARKEKKSKAPITRMIIHVCQLDERPSEWMEFPRRISASELEKGVLILANLVSSSGTSEDIIARSDSLKSSVALSVRGISLLSYCSSKAGKQRHL